MKASSPTNSEEYNVCVCVHRSFTVICSIQLSRRPSGTNGLPELKLNSKNQAKNNSLRPFKTISKRILMVYVGARMATIIISNARAFLIFIITMSSRDDDDVAGHC